MIRELDASDTSFTNSLSEKWHEYNNLQINLMSENDELKNQLEEVKTKQDDKRFIGYFTITHYTINSCGKLPSHPAYGITATGTKATPNRTIAVDPSVIPYGAEVIVNGHTYIAEDTGGGIKGNKIDICVTSNSEAMQKGILYNVPVYIKSGAR